MTPQELLKIIRPTEGPGYTDHPRADIKAHRANAKWVRRFGWLWMIITGIGTATSGNYGYVAVGFAVLVIAHAASTDMRVQALEWETELD